MQLCTFLSNGQCSPFRLSTVSCMIKGVHLVTSYASSSFLFAFSRWIKFPRQPFNRFLCYYTNSNGSSCLCLETFNPHRPTIPAADRRKVTDGSPQQSCWIVCLPGRDHVQVPGCIRLQLVMGKLVAAALVLQTVSETANRCQRSWIYRLLQSES